MVKTSVSPKVQHLLLVGLALACVSCLRAADIVSEPYLLDTGLVSRSISFENPTGAPGEGGKAASKLGVGRKGSPSRSMKPGDVQQLCDIAGPGTIRHIWVTTRGEPLNLRSLVIRAWWGEGEIKVYMDGDKDFPTICGTGSEDYVGLSWTR